MPISFDMRVALDPEVMIRNVGEESVILDLKTERYLGLNEVGSRMWAVVTEAPSIQHAYQQLLDEYDVDPDRLTAELQQFLQRLIEHGLVTLVPVTPDAPERDRE